MEEIIFKTIWQSEELGQLKKGGQGSSECREDLAGDRLELSWKEKIWLLSKQEKISDYQEEASTSGISVSSSTVILSNGDVPLANRPAGTVPPCYFHSELIPLPLNALSRSLRRGLSECSKTIDEEQLSCPELRRSAASTNVSALNLSCSKESDSSESWDFEGLPSPLAGTENQKALWSTRQPDSSPTKWEDMEKLMAESESDVMRQNSLTIKEKLRNLCQKTRELEDRIASVSELKISRQLEPGNSQKRMLVQIAQSMSDLRQRLTSQLNEVRGIGSPDTSTGAEGKVSLQMDDMRESPGEVSDSKASLQHEEARTLSDFRGKFETFSLQWERVWREHHHTMQMLRDLKMEIDSIANNSKKMFSAFDQIQKNIHKLSHIRPLIQHIQKLLERRKNHWSTETGYLSSVPPGSEQGEVLQQLVDQAFGPLVERMQRLHHTFDCGACAVNSQQNGTVP